MRKICERRTAGDCKDDDYAFRKRLHDEIADRKQDAGANKGLNNFGALNVEDNKEPASQEEEYGEV